MESTEGDARKGDKRYDVSFTFPELPSGKMYQHARVDAADFGLAVNRALKVIRKYPALRKKRLGSIAKITVLELRDNAAE